MQGPPPTLHYQLVCVVCEHVAHASIRAVVSLGFCYLALRFHGVSLTSDVPILSYLASQMTFSNAVKILTD